MFKIIRINLIEFSVKNKTLNMSKITYNCQQSSLHKNWQFHFTASES